MMLKPLDKTYDPQQVERRMAEKWAATGAFHAQPGARQGAAPYAVVIPPPNVTAPLHLGHALNNTLQDILVRYHRMLGDNTMWMPGTDHAGIATQTVVDKRLKQEGKPALADYKKLELSGENGREQFIDKVQTWKDEYEQRITEQLKTMGCSCDWDRQRFTMDQQCAKAVREAFFQLFKDGLIYRGKRLVNWDPVSQTALADDEVENIEVDGSFWYLKYPVVDENQKPTGEFVTVATTRPETMLGDTAVAVNPKDEQNAHFIGKKVKLPIVGRVIPIIGDDYVTIGDENSDDPKAQYASGFLKVTPAHDPNDWEIGRRHDLEVINIMAPDGSISDQHGWEDISEESKQLIGLSREDARKQIVRWFKDHELLAEVKPYRHSVGHSYRSHAAIEPYLSDQWYVKVTDDRMAGAALRALKSDKLSLSCEKDSVSSEVSSSGETGFSSGGAGVSPATNKIENGRTGVPPVSSAFTTHRRHLPHWQIGGRTYFVTFRLQEGQLALKERQIVFAACLHWNDQRAVVHLATVMPDHVHLLITPLKKSENGWYSLPELLHSIKSYTAHQICNERKETGKIWQEEYFDRIVRDDDEFQEKYQYMLNNPVKAGLVKDPKDYQFTVGRASRPSQIEKKTAGQRQSLLQIAPEASPAVESSNDKSGVLSSVLNAEESAFQADDGRDARPTEEEKDGGRDARPTDWEGELEFTPQRYAKTFQSWHENIRDWCISRQLWWGHRIPVWVHPTGPGNAVLKEECEQRNDVVLTQFSSSAAVYVCLLEDDENLISKLKAAGFIQDPDVLDTWFSSALWPLSTLGWPEDTKELQTWNPTSVLCTAREIITLWVSRMVMFNIYFRGCLPFKDVFIHAMIQDGHGQKMSKSLGNGVDPMDIIYSHGSDAMRFTLASMTTHTQDVRLPVDMVCPHTDERFTPKYITSDQGYQVAAPIQEAPDGSGRKMVSSYGYVSGLAKPTDDMPLARNTSKEFDIGQRFANKLWNAARFAMENLSRAGVPPVFAEGEKEVKNVDDGLGRRPTDARPTGMAQLDLADKWILCRLAHTVEQVNSALENYQFSVYTEVLYDFFRRDLCDWYIEIVKPTVKQNSTQRAVLGSCLDMTLRMLHPMMPFITEQLWETLNEIVPQRGADAGLDGLELPVSESLILARWPKVDKNQLGNQQAQDTFDTLQQVVGAIRQVRTTHKVAPRQKIDITIKACGDIGELFSENQSVITTLAGIDNLKIDADATKPQDGATAIVGNVEIYIHGIVDEDAEKDRLQKRAQELEKSIKTLRGRLSNDSYVNKAPANLVQQTRDQLAEAEKQYAALEVQTAK